MADTLNTDTALAAPSAALKTVESKGMSSNVRVPFAALNVIPDFNVRVVNDEYKARVRNIADSIKANGYYEYKPLGVFKIDGKDGLFIHDGHTRYDALKLLISEGAEIADVPVSLAPAGTTVEDLTISLVQSNEGERLAPLELAIVAKRLLGFGMDKETVANRLGKTTRYLDNLLVLAGAPKAVRDAVGQNKIAAAEAVKIVRKDPAKAAETVKAKVKAAADAGKAKATPKATAAKPSGPKMKRIPVEIDFPKGAKMGDILKTLAGAIRKEINVVDAKGDLIEGEHAKVALTIIVVDEEAEAAKRERAEAAAKKAAEPKPAKAPAKPKAEAKPKADATKPVAKGGSTRKTPAQAKAAAQAHLGGDKAPEGTTAPEAAGEAPQTGDAAPAAQGAGDDGMGGL